MYHISKEGKNLQGNINISGSKSESNRLLTLRAYTSFFNINNLSDSDDTNTMISSLKSDNKEINIGHAGTAMRFLTAYYSSILNSSKILTGSARMKERPILILVEALNNLGADIEYIDEKGYPPIRLNGKLISKNIVTLPANVSSQYVSSLMMLGVSINEGLKIKLSTNITSLPYIHMTKKIIERIGGNVDVKPDEIIPGVANYYASTIYDGRDYASVLVKNREGRPIKIENNKTCTNARVQASVLSLYDSARLKTPLKNGVEAEWLEVDSDIKDRLSKIKDKKIILLTATILSPSIISLLENLSKKYKNVDVINWSNKGSKRRRLTNPPSAGGLFH